MKKILYFCLTILLVFFLSSCSSQNIVLNNSTEYNEPEKLESVNYVEISNNNNILDNIQSDNDSDVIIEKENYDLTYLESITDDSSILNY
ncbi:hypothetical protein JXM83_03315 [Candidatus Woesearchaeota archaeon]|nr:hypothetical protein [Candidatus Woesearchaeota archaeon]